MIILVRYFQDLSSTPAVAKCQILQLGVKLRRYVKKKHPQPVIRAHVDKSCWQFDSAVSSKAAM